MNEISPQELVQMRQSGEDFQLIDIREAYETESVQIGGTIIPMDEVLERSDELRNDCKVIVFCRTGKRATAVVEALQRLKGMTNVYSLQGGIFGYIDQVEPALPKY
jgi:rhodanese-related sulfurtransferase